MNSTREKLLPIALRLFASKGYEGAGVQEIVSAAGVTKPTLYHHFKSKEGLLVALLESALTPFLDSLDMAFSGGGLEADLGRFASKMFEFAKQHPDLYRFFLSLMFAPQDSPAFSHALLYARRQHGLLEQLFLRGFQEEKCELQNEAALLAANFQGLAHNYITLYLQGFISLDSAMAQRVAHQFLYGLYAA